MGTEINLRGFLQFNALPNLLLPHDWLQYVLDFYQIIEREVILFRSKSFEAKIVPVGNLLDYLNFLFILLRFFNTYIFDNFLTKEFNLGNVIK